MVIQNGIGLLLALGVNSMIKTRNVLRVLLFAPAVVTPIGRVKSAHGEFAIGGQSTGALTLRLRSALLDIQRGTAPDPYGWIQLID